MRPHPALADRAFLDRAGGDGPGQRGIEVIDHDVAMHRRPVAHVVAQRSRRPRCCRPALCSR